MFTQRAATVSILTSQATSMQPTGALLMLLTYPHTYTKGAAWCCTYSLAHYHWVEGAAERAAVFNFSRGQQLGAHAVNDHHT